MIDVHRLRVLRAVAEHGSFNQAATALRLTPSAVSQQVAALERSLGAQVVARSTRGVTLTQAGSWSAPPNPSPPNSPTHSDRSPG